MFPHKCEVSTWKTFPKWQADPNVLGHKLLHLAQFSDWNCLDGEFPVLFCSEVVNALDSCEHPIPPWSLSPYLCSSAFYFLFHKSRTDVMPMVRWMPVTSLVMAHAFCVSLWSPYVSLKWYKSGGFRIGTHSMMVTKPTTLECISVSRKHWATQRQMQSHVNTGLRSVAKVRGCHLACLLHCQQQKQWRNAPSLCCPPIQPKIWLSRQQSQNRKKAVHTGIMICY